MKIVPLQPVPAQTLSVLLGDQNCQIRVEQKGDYCYLSLAVNNAPIVNTVICRDRVALVRYDYLGFSGDLAFVDMAGTSDPQYAGLGSRYQLVYTP